MKKLLSVAFFMLLVIVARSQEESSKDTTWTTGGIISVTVSQVKFSQYWAAGGINSVSATFFGNLFANYKKERSTWDNNLHIGYGLINQDAKGTIKSDDRIDLSSKYGQYAFEHWYYSALLNFRSQMSNGFNYKAEPKEKISALLAPAYITTSVGMDYKPNKNFTLFLSPFTGKTTVVKDDSLAAAGAYGVEAGMFDSTGRIISPGNKVRYEIGSYFKLMWNQQIMENVNFLTKLDLFSNFLHNPQNIDVNWEVIISMKVNKFLSANLNTQLLYDDDVTFIINESTKAKGPRSQLKEVFGLGFSYKF